MVREGGVTAPARQRGPLGRTVHYTPVHDLERRLRRGALLPDGAHRVREGDLLDRSVPRRRAARGFGASQPRGRRSTAGLRARRTAMRDYPPPRGPLREPWPP